MHSSHNEQVDPRRIYGRDGNPAESGLDLSRDVRHPTQIATNGTDSLSDVGAFFFGEEETQLVTAPCLAGIVEIADRLFPFDMAEKWDNCGIQVGDPGRNVRSIAFSLDPTPQTVRFAADHSCQLLVTHHPVLLEPVRTITTELFQAELCSTLLAWG